MSYSNLMVLNFTLRLKLLKLNPWAFIKILVGMSEPFKSPRKMSKLEQHHKKTQQQLGVAVENPSKKKLLLHYLVRTAL